jgi:hypothetical protein
MEMNRSVAAGVSPAVEGVPPPGRKVRKTNGAGNFRPVPLRAMRFPPGWKPQLYGRQDARHYSPIHGKPHKSFDPLRPFAPFA